MRYLTQEPDAPVGVYGSIDTGDETMTFEVGQVHYKLIGRGGTRPTWIVAAIELSPDPEYDALIVFAEVDTA